LSRAGFTALSKPYEALCEILPGGCANVVTLLDVNDTATTSRRKMGPSLNGEGNATNRPPSGGASDSARYGRGRV